jgi:3-hydroxybutyryl-CoA dehydratase
MSELHGCFFEDLHIGMTAVFSKTITDADILLFSAVSGDTNPAHLDEEFARTTAFEGRVAHGMLTASLFSTLVGTKLPGPGCMYMGQTLKFLAPVRAGDTVFARVTVRELLPDKNRVVLDTTCKVGDKLVVAGEAVLKVPRREPRTVVV